MGYKTEELTQTALNAVREHKLIFLDEISAYLPCSLKTIHNHKLHELPELKEAIEKNKIEMKATLRRKWYGSDNPTLQMALYKLLATEAERRQLAMEYHSHENKSDHNIIQWQPAQQ